MNRLLFKPFYTIALCTFLAGCSSTDWETHAVPTSNQAADMLAGNVTTSQNWNLDESRFPQLTVPQNVRPCCAFGDMQKVKFGPVPVPFSD